MNNTFTFLKNSIYKVQKDVNKYYWLSKQLSEAHEHYLNIDNYSNPVELETDKDIRTELKKYLHLFEGL